MVLTYLCQPIPAEGIDTPLLTTSGFCSASTGDVDCALLDRIILAHCAARIDALRQSRVQLLLGVRPHVKRGYRAQRRQVQLHVKDNSIARQINPLGILQHGERMLHDSLQIAIQRVRKLLHLHPQRRQVALARRQGGCAVLCEGTGRKRDSNESQSGKSTRLHK